MSINNAGFNPQIQGQMPINYQAQAAMAPYPAPFVQAQPVIYNMPSAQIYAPQAQQVQPNNQVQQPINNVQNNVPNIPLASSLLKSYLTANGKQLQNVSSVSAINGLNNNKVQWKNNLRENLRTSKANIMAVIPRTMNAKDTDGNALIQEGEVRGNFINAVERLDELKEMGINTLHVLPIHPTGKEKAMGTAGSLYAPSDLLSIDPNLKDPNFPGSAEDQCKYFINECHKRGISVMLDLPSCVSLDFAKKNTLNLWLMKKTAPTKPPAAGKTSECSEFLTMKQQEN